MHLHFNGPRSVFYQVRAVTPELLQPPDISYGSSVNTEIRVNTVRFGDGYEQRSLDGINTAPLVIDFAFNNRSLETITEIDKFLRGDKLFYNRTPDEYFYFVPPEPYDGGLIKVPRKFTCLSWKVSPSQSNNYTLSGTMNEVFEP
jgi:phage-related protein